MIRDLFQSHDDIPIYMLNLQITSAGLLLFIGTFIFPLQSILKFCNIWLQLEIWHTVFVTCVVSVGEQIPKILENKIRVPR